MRITAVFFISFALFACAYQPPQGKWIRLDAESLYLEAVVLDKNTMSTNYKNVCVEAGEEIQKQLSEELPARVQPLQFYPAQTPPQEGPSANIQILITDCKVDVEQWGAGGGGGAFTYYLDLDVKVLVSYKGSTLLSYNIKISDQVDTDIPDPLFEFSFEEPVVRILLLFDGRRLLVPD
ncbi:MAG TPA: hypothetical protein ENJ08_16550 [Gammaproteobacteria bacterium]|nr:hypothetical protein [Gammaproteobacteria bacterium]